MTDLDRLWAQYTNGRSKAARDKLIVHYQPLVRYVASRMQAPPGVDGDDLASYGTFGLIDAIERFDPSRGYKFETYAMSRIKGAILDELRDIDWVPRKVRAKAKAVEMARSHLEASLCRDPTQAEIAAELGVDTGAIASVVDVVVGHTFGPIDEHDDSLEDTYGGHDSTIEVDELRRSLVDAVQAVLNDREAVVFTLYYHYRLTLAEIGVVLGVTESRIVQIHTEAVRRVCAHLAH